MNDVIHPECPDSCEAQARQATSRGSNVRDYSITYTKTIELGCVHFMLVRGAISASVWLDTTCLGPSRGLRKLRGCTVTYIVLSM